MEFSINILDHCEQQQQQNHTESCRDNLIFKGYVNNVKLLSQAN